MKFNKLVLAVSLGMVSFAGVVTAAEIKGDSRVHYPAFGTTVPDSASSTDVWFISASEGNVDGYTVDLIDYGSDTGSNGCDGTIVGEYRHFLSSSDVVCDNESVASLGKTGDYISSSTLKLCKWTTPDLTTGNYAIGINSYKFGEPSGSEVHTLCNVPHATTPDGLPDEALTTNEHEAPVGGTSTKNYGKESGLASATKTPSKSVNYQTFKIDTGVTSAITQAPSKMVISAPDWNGAIDFDVAGTGSIAFKDYSPAEGKANWYEVYIYNSTKAKRIELEGDSLNAKNWYKVDVDVGTKGLVFSAGGTDAGGTYVTVTLADVDAVLADSADGVDATDILQIWVRGWNDEKGEGSWSSEVRGVATDSTDG